MSVISYQDVRHFKCNDLRRWKLQVAGLCSVRLHHWVKGDPPDYQHAHPWRFVTLVLAGGYTDVGAGRSPDVVRAFAVRYRGTAWRHSVVDVLPGTWTAVITGRAVRDWRFWIGPKQVDEGEWNLRTCD